MCPFINLLSAQIGYSAKELTKKHIFKYLRNLNCVYLSAVLMKIRAGVTIINMKMILKVSCSVILLISYFVAAAMLYPLLLIAPSKTRFLLNYMVHYLSKALLRILSVKVTMECAKKTKTRRRAGVLIVCNHLSYLDILVASSQYPTCFVTSNEMKNTPGLGIICILGGCVFVERRSRENIAGEVDEIKEALEIGLNVMFFPEAKSTSGEEVIPFKRSLFRASVLAKSDTLPLCINYKFLNEEKVTIKNKDIIFWYGEMTFSPHFITVCKQKSIDVTLSELNLITIEETDFDSKLLRDMAFEVIAEKYCRISH